MREFNTIVIANKKMVVVTTKYEGKTIKGVAKCAPEDTFDVEVGTKLAKLRCIDKLNGKIATNMAIELNDLYKYICELTEEYNYRLDKYKYKYAKALELQDELETLQNNLKK